MKNKVKRFTVSYYGEYIGAKLTGKYPKGLLEV